MKQIIISLFLALFAGILLLVTGCGTLHEVTPLAAASPPAAKPTAMAVGEIRVCDARLKDAEKKAMESAFQRGIETWFREHKGLELLKNVNATNLPASAILVDGKITEVEKGSAALRFWVGFGAGQQRTRGEFTVRDPEGESSMSFAAQSSYQGGQGFGGWDVITLEDLVLRLGEIVAETTEKWVNRGKIK